MKKLKGVLTRLRTTGDGGLLDRESVEGYFYQLPRKGKEFEFIWLRDGMRMAIRQTTSVTRIKEVSEVNGLKVICFVTLSGSEYEVMYEPS